MKSIKQAMTGVAAAAALVASMSAQASTVAIADLNIFTLGLFSGTTPFTAANGTLTINTEARTGTAAASFNGVSAVGIGLSSDSTNTVGGALDIKNRCAGDCGAGTLALYAGGGGFENNTTTHIGTPGTRNFALGDMNISGSTLGGGIQGLTRANASTTGATNKGNGNATILNSAAVVGSFTVGTTFTGRIGVAANAYIQSFVDSILPTKGSATAGYGWNLSIASSDTAFVDLFFRPANLNKAFSSTKMAENNLFSNASTLDFSEDRTFVSGTTYNFTINQSSNATASEIPEPVSLALVGLGLLAAGVARRSKKSK